jgi:hypothetical protein
MVALLIDRGKALRAAGVLTLTIGDMAVVFAPDQAADPAPAAKVQTERPDAMDDPDTFGGELPSFDTSDGEP